MSKDIKKSKRTHRCTPRGTCFLKRHVESQICLRRQKLHVQLTSFMVRMRKNLGPEIITTSDDKLFTSFKVIGREEVRTMAKQHFYKGCIVSSVRILLVLAVAKEINCH